MKVERIRLLIADDDKEYRARILKTVMMTEDIDMIGEAADGMSAVEQVKAFLPDVLLLDSVLPRLDALSVIRQIHALALEKPPHIILLTFPGQEYVEMAGFEQGVDMCVNRNIEARQLCQYIRSCYTYRNMDLNVQSIENYAQEVSLLLDHIRMRAHLDGYAYLRYSVALVCIDGTLMRGITTHIYPMTAEHFGSSSKRVERSIRHAIETTFNAGDYKAIYEVFGNTIDPQRGKPTNGEFIALLAEIVRLQIRQRGESAHA